MAKAGYRRAERSPALRPATPIGEGGHAAGSGVYRSPDERTTPDELVREIERLYRQLQALPFRDHPGILRSHRSGTYAAGSVAYTALETRIRTLARRHWDLTDGGGPCGQIDDPY